MCGRINVNNLDATNILAHDLGAQAQGENTQLFSLSYNCLPGRSLPVVCKNGIVIAAKWGLIPRYKLSSTKPDHFRMFNARIENLPKYHNSSMKEGKLCVIACDGFYEWKNEDGSKQPYFVYLMNKAMYIACIYDEWKASSGKVVKSFSIITLPSSKKMKSLHSRMPAILNTTEAAQNFLNATDYKSIVSQLCSTEDILFHPVKKSMNKASYQEPDCTVKIQKKRQVKIDTLFFSSKKAKT